MDNRTAQQWVKWMQENNPVENFKRTPGQIARMGRGEAAEFCQQYIKEMVKQDGKRGLLYQEREMAKQLGLQL